LQHVNDSETNTVKVGIIERQLFSQEIKNIQELSDHVGSNRRFSKNFFELLQSLTNLLQKHTRFRFDESSFIAYKVLKQSLFNAHVIRQFIWECPFKLIRKVRNKPGEDIPSQHGNIGFSTLQHTLSTLNNPYNNYSVNDKELLAVVLISDKFKPHIIDTKIEVYMNYGGLKKILWKTNDKTRVVYWILLLQKPKLQVVQRKKKPSDEPKKGKERVSNEHISTTDTSPGGVYHSSLGEGLAPLMKIIERTRVGLELKLETCELNE